MEVVAFLDLSNKITRIELEYSMWVKKYYGLNVKLYDNTNRSVSLRKQDQTIYKEENFVHSVPIVEIENFIDFQENLSNEIETDLVVCQLNLDKETINYLKKLNKIYIVLNDLKLILKYKNVLENIQSVLSEENIEYILYKQSEFDYLFYNYKKEQNTSFHFRNVNQKLFSRLIKVF